MQIVLIMKKNALCKVCWKVEKHRLYSSVCLDYEINSTLVTMYIRFFFEVQYEICNMRGTKFFMDKFLM